MPNIENITKLQQLIARQPYVEWEAESGFNMLGRIHPCGTPSCIAGFCETFSSESMSDFLGIYNDCEDELEMPGAYSNTTHPWNSITPAQAVQALEYLKTGTDVKKIWAHLND
jgi:hypothetical protein